MATATLEIDNALLQVLQTEASNQGLSLNGLLWKLTQNGLPVEPFPLGIDATETEPEETIGERLERKGLVGMIDSSVPTSDPYAQPRHTEFGAYLAKKHEDEKRRFFVLEEIAEKDGMTPQEWVRQNFPNGKDAQGRSLSQILDSFSVTEMSR